jgi:hypothetical protein
MKKLLLTLLSISLLIASPIVKAQEDDIKTLTCTQTNGSKVSVKSNNTTISYSKCEAIKTNNESKCKELIEASTEFQKIKTSTDNNKTKLEQAEKEILNCQLQISEKQKADNIINSTTYKEKLATQLSSKNCVTNDPSVKTLFETESKKCELTADTNNPTQQIETLILLDNIFKNKFVYQMIEPLTDEDTVIQKRTCTYEFLRNKNGLLQTDTSETNQVENRDAKFYQDNRFIITENKCYTTFVDSCTPNLILDARVKLSETELPISVYCKTYQVIYGSSGTDFIKQFVNIIYNLAVGVVGVIAVIVIIVNGIKISTSGDDSGAVSEAKERIAQSIFGLAVLFLAWIILRSVNPNFFTDSELTSNNPSATQTTETSETNTQN